jgi:hypothetical protein
MDYGERNVELSRDPDLPGKIAIAYGPNDRFGLGRIECAADLPMVVNLKLLSETPALHILQLEFRGHSLGTC